jgi:predicted nucleotidyltransferase
MLSKEKKHRIIKKLQQKIEGLAGVYLFGSYADGMVNPQSDLDIAFLTSQKIPHLLRWEIQEDLASILDTDVDLIDIKDASVILRTEIIENGILIHAGNLLECEKFETVTYSMYADLNEARIDIINDINEQYG